MEDNTITMTIHGELKEGRSVMKATILGQEVDVDVDAKYCPWLFQNNDDEQPKNVTVTLAHPSTLKYGK